jgi:sarcosine oxidase / L-pipecolate oxidase
MADSRSLNGTTVIVGAGVFGTSTAYHLSLTAGHGDILVIDQHEYPTPGAHSTEAPLGASHDVNKIVRADYSSKFHMQLALEAIERWQSWDIISPFYHRTGWILLAEKDVRNVPKIRQNFQECLGRDEMREMSLYEIRNGWGGAFRGADTTIFDQAYWNPLSAWSEADKAVEAVLSEAIRNGVKYQKGKMKGLVLRSDQQGVEGIALENGSTVTADRVILATGAWTSSLMNETEDALSLAESMRVESQVKAAGVCNVHFKLEKEDQDRYKDIPIFIHGSRGRSEFAIGSTN